MFDAFVNDIEGIWKPLIKSADDIHLREVANTLENKIKTENYHDKIRGMSERKKMVNVRQDTEAEILSPCTKCQVKRKMFGTHNPWK